MDSSTEQFFQIFHPDLLTKSEELNASKYKLVHYTSAQAVLSILKKKEIWLRNTRCMNDLSEVEHGFNCLSNALKADTGKLPLKTFLDARFPGLFSDLVGRFDSWLPKFRSATYIACVSEHYADEDVYGRLSMWRAYGGATPVAVIVNPGVFASESDALKAYSYPVRYLDLDGFSSQVLELENRMAAHETFIQSLPRESVVGWLFQVFQRIIMTTKHPGFREEKEWRVVYNPSFQKSDYIREEIEIINGVPQLVCKLPLCNMPDQGLVGLEFDELIDRIIIGPCDQQGVIAAAIRSSLEAAGVGGFADRVQISGIPLRR